MIAKIIMLMLCLINNLNKALLCLALISTICFFPISNLAAAQSTKDIMYTAKFVCGSIPDDNGPLRPGHYDTSLNILNKKSYRIGLVWTAVINDGPTSNAIYKNLDPENSTGMDCQDLREILGIETKDLVEGFVIIKVPLSSLKGFNNEEILLDPTEDMTNILDVQVFYTANALDTLPYKIAEEKISFYIIQDETDKIPKKIIRKLLDITMPSTLNEITDTEEKVKSILAKKYDIEKRELDKVVLRIKSVSIGVGAILDDHAVSLHVVRPQVSD